MAASIRLLAIACAAGAALVAAVPAPARADVMPPEDPAASAKSTAQWRDHMAAEEHERRLHYDRDHLKDHRAVLKSLVAARARYDRARTKSAVLAIQKRLPTTVEEIRRRITRIDHWGTNSNLLGDYDAYLNALSESYPAARIEMMRDGAPGGLDMVRHQLDQITRHITDWLAEAAAAKDE